MRRLILAPFVLTAIAACTLGLAVLFSGQGTFTANETITVSATNLDITIEPNQVIEKTITVTNTGSHPANVVVTAEVIDEAVGGPYLGITVTDSQAVTVQGGTSADLTFTITANNGIPPGTGKVELSVIRP